MCDKNLFSFSNKKKDEKKKDNSNNNNNSSNTMSNNKSSNNNEGQQRGIERLDVKTFQFLLTIRFCTSNLMLNKKQSDMQDSNNKQKATLYLRIRLSPMENLWVAGNIE